jgi:hypothetical protein
MCDPVTAGLILTGVGGGASALNERGTLRRKDRQTAEGIRRQGVIESGASRSINEQIEDIAGSTGESERATSLEGFLNAIRTAQASTEGALDPIAAANPRFAERVSGGKESIATAGTEQAGRLSRIDAPRFQRQAEGQRIGRTAGDINELARQSTAEDFLTQLRVAAERSNPLVEALAGVSKGVGSALTLGAGTGIGKLVGKDSLSKLLKAGTLVDQVPVSPFFGTVA